MIAPTWLQKWLRARGPRPTPLDPLAQFSTLTVERLEERRVLSVSTLVYDGTVLDVGITGTDDVEISYDDGWMHFYSSDTDTTQSMEFDPTVNSLRIWGDADAQSVTFSDGTDPDTISMVSLSVADSIEAVTVDTVVTAAMDVDIDVADALTVNNDVTSTGGSIIFEAGGSIVIDVGASLDAANSVEITSLGSSVLTQEITAGTFVDIEGTAVTLNGGIQADCAITVDATTGDLNVYGTITGGKDVSLTAANDLTIHADSGVSSIGEGNILLSADRTVTISEDVSTTVLGTITVTGNSHTGARNIVVDNGAVVSTEDGNLTLDADQGVQVGGSFVGINITGPGTMVAVTGTGNLSLAGRGGNSGPNQHGVAIRDSAIVQGGTGGIVTIKGIGGETTDSGNFGVLVDSAGAAVQTDGADIVIEGQGGGAGASSMNNLGVYIRLGGLVSAGGDGTVSITGNGGDGGGDQNYGVFLNSGSVVTSNNGNVQVVGFGGGQGADSDLNFGVYLNGLAEISAGGTGSVNIAGTGGSSTGTNNYGVFLTGANVVVSGAGGGIVITGTEGSGTEGWGIYLNAGAVIEETGNGSISLIANSMRLEGAAGIDAGSGSVYLTQLSAGVEIDLGSTTDTIGGPLSLSDAELDLITAGTVQIGNANSGNITISDQITHANHLSLTTGGGVTFNHGVTMAADKNLSVVSLSTAVGITLANANADIVTTGTGSVTLTATRNILMNAGSSITTVDGGISLNANQQVTATAGTFTGIFIDSATIQSTGDGDILLAGRSGNSGTSAGVRVQNASVIESTSTGVNAGSITIVGSDVSGGTDSDGVLIWNVAATPATTPTIRSAGGAIEITGSTTGDDGVQLLGQVEILATNAATITITGSGGGAAGKDALVMSQAGSLISSETGSITIVALVGAVNLLDNAHIESDSGSITITADNFELDSTIVIATTSTVTLVQMTDGRQISLGSETVGQLSLTDAELDRITAGTLIIGDANSGAITISAAISPANITTLELVTGAAIVDGNASGADITVEQLVLMAATGIGAGDALELDVDVLAFRNETSGNVDIVNEGFLTIDTAGSLTGMAGAELGNFGTGTTSVTATSPLTIAADLSSVGSLTLTAGETDDDPDFEDVLTINAGVTVSVTGMDETLSLRAGDDVVIEGAAEAATGSLVIVAGFGDLDDAGAITINGSVTAEDLISLSAVTGLTPTTAVFVTDELEILGSGDFILSGNNDVNTLSANLEGTLTFHDVDGFVIGMAGATTGITLTETGAALTLSTDAGTIGLAADVTTDGDQNYQSDVEILADITLTAGSGSVAFDAGLEGTFDLVIASADDVTFTGDVGTVDELASLDIMASGTVSILGNMRLGEDGTHDGTLTINAQSFVLTGSIDTQDAAATLGHVDITATSLELEGTITTADGNVELNGAAELTDDLVITTGAGDVSILSALTGSNGDEALEITSTSGGVILLAAVSSIGNLTLQSTAAGGQVTLNGSVSVNGDVDVDAETIEVASTITTSGLHADGDVSLTSTSLTILTSNIDAAGSIELDGFTRLDASLSLIAGGDVTITGALDANDFGGPTTSGLTIDADGNVYIMADVGTGVTPGSDTEGLAFLNIIDGNSLTACGTWVIDSSVSFAMAVLLCDDLDITANGDVTFQSTVDSDGIAVSTILTINAEDVDFQAAVGGTDALTGLVVTASGNVTAGDGLSVVDTIDVTASGATGIDIVGDVTAQTGSVFLTADDIGDVSIDGSVSAAVNISLFATGAAGGEVTVTGDVTSTSTTAGHMILVTGEAVTIDGSVTGAGIQVIGLDGDVGIGGDVTSTATGIVIDAQNAGSIDIDGAIDSAATIQLTTTTGTGGGSITVDGTLTAQTTAQVTADDDITLGDAVSGMTGVTIVSATGSVDINGTVSSTAGTIGITANSTNTANSVTLSIDGDIDSDGGAIFLTANSSGGTTEIEVTGYVQAASNVNINSTNGDVSIGDSVDSENSFVTILAQNTGSILVQGDVTAATNVQLNTTGGTGGGSIEVEGLVDAVTGTVLIQANDDITIDSTIDANSTITVWSLAGSVDIGGGVTSDSANISLVANQSNVADMDVLLHVGGAVQAATGVSITAAASGTGTGDVWIEGNVSVTTSGGVGITGTNGTVQVDGNIATTATVLGTFVGITGASVDVAGDIDARTSVTINGTNGDVRIDGFVNAETSSVNLQAHNAGSIDVTGDVTAATSIVLSTTTFGTGGGSIDVGGLIDAGSSLVTVSADDDITLGSTVDASGNVFISSRTGSVDIGDSVESGSGSVTLNANSTNVPDVDVMLHVGGNVTAATGVLITAAASGTGTGDVWIEGSVSVTASGSVSIGGSNGTVDIDGNVSTMTAAAGTTIVIAGASVDIVGDIDARTSATISGTNGDVLIDGFVNAETGSVNLQAHNSGSIDVTGDVTAATSIVLSTTTFGTGGGSIDVGGLIAAGSSFVTVSADDDITLGSTVDASGNVSISSRTGSVDIGDSVESGSGSVTLNANSTNVPDVDVMLHVGGNVTAATGVSITAVASGVGTGDVWIEGDLSTTTSGGVGITGGNGTVEIDGNISTTATALGTFVGITGATVNVDGNIDAQTTVSITGTGIGGTTEIAVTGYVQAISNVNINSTNGDVSIGDFVDSASGFVTILAQNTGSILVQGDVTAATNVQLNTTGGTGGGSIDVEGLVDADTGFVLIQANDDITIDSTIDANGTITVWSLAGSIDIGGAVTSDAASISLIANQSNVAGQAVSLHVGGNVTAATGVSITAVASGVGTGDVWIEGDLSTTTSGGVGITGGNGTVEIDGNISTTATALGTFVGITGATVNVDGNIDAQTTVSITGTGIGGTTEIAVTGYVQAISNVNINSTNGDVSIGDFVDSASSFVTILAQNTGSILVQGDVTASTNVQLNTTLGTGGGSIDVGGAITSDLANVTLLANDNLEVTGAILAATNVSAVTLTGTMTFSSTIDATAGFVQLNNAGLLTLLGDVTAGTTFEQNGGAVDLCANVTADDGIDFEGDVTLTMDVTLTTVGGNVIFQSTVETDGLDAWDLTIDSTTGNVEFQDTVGTTVGEELGAVDITTGGNVSLTDRFVAVDDITIDAAEVLIDEVDTSGAAGALGNLTITHTGDLQLRDAELAGNFLENGGGTTFFDGSLTTTDGNVTFTGAVQVHDGEIETDTGNITFQNTVDGAATGGLTLTIASNTGDIEFQSAVGSTTALSTLTSDTDGSTSFDSTLELSADLLVNQNATTPGDVTFSDAVDVGGAATITGSAVDGTSLTAVGAVSVTAGAGGLEFTETVESTGAAISLQSSAVLNAIHIGGDVLAETTVTINSTAGNVNLDGLVTASSGQIDIDAATDIDVVGTLDAGTTIDIDAGTSVSLHADLLANAAITVTASNGALDITGDVTSANDAILLESLAGAALVHVGGNLLAATSITISNLTGGVDLDGTVTATSGDVSISADTLSAAQAITAGSDVSLVTTNGTTLADTADVSAGGTIDITGDLETAANLQTVTGAVTVNGNVTLTGNVRFDSDDDVGPAGTGNITVTGTIDLASFTLTIDAGTGGDIDLQDTVSGTGDLVIEEGNNQTYATISINDFRIEDATTSVVLNGPVTATAVGMDLGDIFICSRGTLNIESTLTADGTVTLKADDGMKLDADLNVANIEFQSAVLLCTDITITATGDVVFGSTVDSAVNQQYLLVVNAAGLTDFQGTVGGGTNQELGSLTTDAAGQTQIGANVTTAFDQIYLDAVTLTADVTLTGSDNNASGEGVEFHHTLDGDDFDLTISGGGSFAAAVIDLGDFVADRIDTESTFAAASVDVSGTADLGGNVTTTGTQHFGDAVLLTTDVIVSSTGVGAAGNITFAATIDGAFDLTITSAGTTRFEGIIGGGTELTRLTTNGGGTTVIDTSAVTAGEILFTDDVVLAQSTTVTGTNSLEFAGALSGLTGTENLLAISGGAATFAAISNLTDVTIDAAGITTLQGNISIAGTLSTIGGDVTKIDTASIEAEVVQFGDAVELCQDLSISSATITFSSAVDEAVGATGSHLTLEITDPNAAAGDITFSDAIGSLRALDGLLIVDANDVLFASTIELDGDLVQQDGAGTTEFHGTSGTGIGGELLVNTNSVEFFDLTVVAVGAVVITAQNGITFHANSGLNAGSSTVALRANQDQTGTQGFTQASGTIIQTTNETDAALVIEVGGDGSAAISDLRAGTTSGVVTVTVGGSITDNSVLEAANITAASVALTAVTGIGGAGDADIDTQVANLEAQTSTGGIVIQEADDVTIGGVTGLLEGVDVTTSGDIAIATINGSITVSEQISGPDNISLIALGSSSDLTILVNSGVVSTNDDILLSADRTVTISEDVSTGGAGTITVTGNSGAGARNIVVNSGAVVTVVNGDLLLDADQGSQEAGNFSGISIDNATVQTTGTGDVTLQGRGGDDAAGSQAGVSISNGGVVQSTSTLATAGTIEISGIGGASAGNSNAGINISGATSTVQSVNGDITLNGTGGGTGASAGNTGIVISGSVRSTGTTADAADISLTGVGGLTSGNGNLGIDVNGANALVTSVRGAIELDGTGGGTGTSGNNVGVRIAGGGDVTSTGASAVGVEIHGQGGASTGGGNAGVLITGAGTSVSAVTGSLEIVGIGGGAGATGGNHGLVIESAAVVSSTGAGVGAATVTLEGTGSASSGNSNQGVVIDAATVATVNGALSMTGQGGGAGASSQNHGVVARNSALITSTGLGDIAITGSGGTGTGGQNHGVVLNQADVVSNGNSAIAPGDVNVTATVGSGPDSLALLMSNGGSISAIDPAFPGGATVTLTTLAGDVREESGFVILSDNLLLLGPGSFTLNEANNIGTFAANVGGFIALNDVNGLTVGTVKSTSGITTSDDDVKLTVLAGGLTIGDNIGPAGTDDITLGGGNLTLNVNGAVTQTTNNVITASGLQLLGTGTVTLNEAGNDVTTLAANYNGTIAYTDANTLIVGTVTDTPSGMTTSGITTSNDDVKLTVLAGGLTIGDNVGVAGADDISLGTGNLTLNVIGAVTQTTDNVITASGLQLLGTGTVTLNEAENDVTTLAANYNGTITFTDANTLIVGTVTDTPSGMSTSGITTSNDDVKLTVLAGGLTIGDNVGPAGTDDISLGTGNLTLDVVGVVTQTTDNVILANGLQLLGTGTVALNEADNNVTTIAATYVGDISYVDVDALIVGTVTDQAEVSMVSSTGIVTNGGDVVLTAAGNLTVNADVNTSPGAGGAITVTGGEINAQLIAGAGDITLNGGNPDLIINVAQTSATTMTLQANRDVIINAVVTTTGPGADLVVTADLDLDGVGGVQVTQAGQLAAADDLTVTGSDLFATPLSSDSIRIDADGANDQLLAGGDILLQHQAVAPATADIVINGRIRSTGGNITLNAADEIHATSAIRADGPTGNVTFEDALILTGHLDVTSGGNTTFEGTVATSDFDLTVDGGANGDITFEQAVTGGGHLTIVNGDAIRFDEIVQVDNLTVQGATTSVTFVSAVTVQQDVHVTSGGSITQQSTLSAGNDVNYVADGAILIEGELTATSDLSLTSTMSSIAATAALEATNGTLTAAAGTSFSATQTLTAGDRVEIDAVTTLTLAETADITSGAGGVSLSATDIVTAAEITTLNGNVDLTGAVRLTGDVTIDTGSSGNLTVTGTIDGTAAEMQSLFLSTGTGDILITGDVGATTALQQVVITDARNVTFGGAIAATRLLQQSGTGVTTIVGAVETFGSEGIQLTTTSIQFTAGSASMDSHGNIITLTADAITLPTTFTNAMDSTVTLQTLTAGTSIGLEDASQDLNFTDAQLDTIHSANLVIGSADQTAGIIVGTDGAVSLDENLTLLTAGTIQVTGALSATAANWLLLEAGDDIAVTGSVSTLSGDLTLRADDDITLGGMALVESVSGNITVRADADHDANGSGGGITMADGAIIDSGTGRLALEADEDIVIGQLASSNGTADAISIITHSGGAVDGGDTDLDIVLNNASGVVTIHAVTGVGSAAGGGADAALETQINQLQVVNTTSGDVRIDEVDALTILGIEQFGPGDVVVQAGGTLTVAAGGPGIQSEGGDLRLTTVGAMSDLVLNAALTSRGGDVVLIVGDDLIQSVTAPIDTGSGHLTMNVTGDVDLAGSIDTAGGDFDATIGGDLQQAVTAPISTGGGNLTLDVLGNVGLAAAVTTSGGNFSATIGGNLTQAVTAPLSTGSGDVFLDVIGNVSLAAVVTTAGGHLTAFIDGDFTQAVTAPLETDGGDLSLDVGGSASFSGAVSTNGGDFVGMFDVDFTQSATAPISTGGGELNLTVGGQMTLASLVDTAGGNLQFDVTGDLTQEDTAPITTGSGDVTLLVDGNLSLAALLATAGGHVLLDVGGAATIAQTAPISTGGGHLTATVDQQLSLASQVQTSGGNVQLTVGQSASLAATAAILTENGNFQGLINGQFTMADGAVINTSLGTLSLIAGGNITVGQLITTNATASALLLRSTGGGIIDGGDTGGADLIANAAGAIVTIEAAQGVGSAAGFGADAAIDTQINTLILRNTTTGNVRLSEVDDLRILELKQTASGSVTVDSVGNMHLVGGQPGVTATSGNVTLRANGPTSSLTIDSLVQTTSGQILVSAAQNVTLGAAARILSQSGNVTVVADSDNTVNGSGGALFMANGAIINAGTGNITARADGNITVGQMLSTGTVSLTSTSAGLIDGGDAGGVDIQANALVIQTRTGIGSTNAIETSVAQLAARNTTSGAIRIENSSGNLLTISQVGSVSGITNNGGSAAEISVVNIGGITVDRDVRNTTGGNIRLTANANGGNDDHLTVNSVIAASGGNGSILLTAGNNLVLNDTGADVDMSVVNQGEVLGTAGNDVIIGPDVVIQSATGVVTNTEPVLIDVLTPQVSALGVGTLTMTVQRPLEVGTVILIDWGDGTVESFVVTEEGQTTLTFTHQYLGPPDLANPAADIPIQVTVLNPSFTTGAMASPTPGTMRVANGDYVPNIRFAANGQILGPSDIGPLNQTIFNGVFKIPGDGLASFIFDLTPPVQILDFPQSSSLDASLLAVPQPPTQLSALDGIVSAAEDLQADERVVILEVLGPDGEVRERVILSEDVLDDLDGVVRQLPDGRYRFQLREPGDTQTRLLQEVLIREGKISDEFDNSSDRPRSLKTQGQGMTGPAPADNPLESSPPVDPLVPENQKVEDADPGEDDSAISSFRGSRAWRQALARSEGEPEVEVTEVSVDSGESDDSTLAAAGMLAAPVVGSAFSGRRFGRAARLLRQYGQS